MNKPVSRNAKFNMIYREFSEAVGESFSEFEIAIATRAFLENVNTDRKRDESIIIDSRHGNIMPLDIQFDQDTFSEKNAELKYFQDQSLSEAHIPLSQMRNLIPYVDPFFYA
jgi:hypothetical protein